MKLQRHFASSNLGCCFSPDSHLPHVTLSLPMCFPSVGTFEPHWVGRNIRLPLTVCRHKVLVSGGTLAETSGV